MQAPDPDLKLERIESPNGIEFVWSPADRIARMRFLHPDSFGTGVDARVLTDALRAWGAGSSQPYAMLVDAERTSTVDAEYRATFFAFYATERDRAHAAWFNASPHVQAIITMFITAVEAEGPFRGAYFDTEVEARAWLQTFGIGS